MKPNQTVVAAVNTPSTDSIETLRAQIAELQASNAALAARKSPAPGRLTAKVSAKGALSVYGLGRFPVTLYAGQWERLIAAIPVVQEAIVANKATLVRKD